MLPDAYITIHISELSFDQAYDPFSNELISSNVVEQLYMDLYDSLVQAFSGKCNIHLSIVPDDKLTDEVEIRLDGTTGDVESDQQLEELLYDTALRKLEALTSAQEDSINLPTLIESTLYLTDQRGATVEAEIKYRRPVNSNYTFYSVTPKDRAHRVAALCSSRDQYIETNWRRKIPLTVFSIFDDHRQWYNAQTGTIIKGSLANYLGIDINKTML